MKAGQLNGYEVRERHTQIYSDVYTSELHRFDSVIIHDAASRRDADLKYESLSRGYSELGYDLDEEGDFLFIDFSKSANYEPGDLFRIEIRFAIGSFGPAAQVQPD